ncbi:hypothetical protein IQ07DRAFT_364333 [Pyrenochaeta sp. DS3sAY3a]|nr:hypothetical protein IQ07DRAFT_364333 [Pyrenochaeta sp. DS3sAY3a]
MASNSIPLQPLSAPSASSAASTGNVQNVSSPSSRPAAVSQSSAATANSPSTSSTSTTQVLPSTSVPPTNAASQAPRVTLSRRIFGDLTALNVFGMILTVLCVIWAIKSYSATELANTIAQEEVCRNHPVRFFFQLSTGYASLSFVFSF